MNPQGREVIACEECRIVSWDAYYDQRRHNVVGIQTKSGQAQIPMSVTPAIEQAMRDRRELWLLLVDEHGDAAAGLERAVKAEAKRDELQHEVVCLRARIRDALTELHKHETANAIRNLEQTLREAT